MKSYRGCWENLIKKHGEELAGKEVTITVNEPANSGMTEEEKKARRRKALAIRQAADQLKLVENPEPISSEDGFGLALQEKFRRQGFNL